MKKLNSTPKQDGFRMPAEFELHEGTFLIWPERSDNWRLGGKPAQEAFINVAKAISEFEPVTVVVSRAQYEHATISLPENIRVVEMSSNDAWMRDCGPTFVINDKGDVRGIDWEFNAWGGLFDGLYFPWDQDNKIASKICRLERKDFYKAENFVLEGGAIHVDGEGTVYTTEECLLSKGRNPHMSKIEIEDMLKEYLNIEKVIWLKRGIYNDETNGHIDNILTVVKPGTVMLAWTDDKLDPQYEISKENLELLENSTDAKGRKINIIKVPLPKPILITAEESKGVDNVLGTLPRCEGDRLAASYVNFYICNGGVVFPTFDDDNDEIVKEILQNVFSERKIIGIPAREILLGGGNIHCITQQLPKGIIN